MLPQRLNLHSEVLELCFKLRLFGPRLAAAIPLRGEFLLRSFDTLCCILISIPIPGQFAMGFIHSFIFNAGHHLWSHNPECMFDPVGWYCYCWAFPSCNCVCGILLTGGTLSPVSCCYKYRDFLDCEGLLLQLFLNSFEAPSVSLGPNCISNLARKLGLVVYLMNSSASVDTILMNICYLFNELRKK